MFLLLCGCECYVPLPRGAVRWSVIVAMGHTLFIVEACIGVLGNRDKGK